MVNGFVAAWGPTTEAIMRAGEPWDQYFENYQRTVIERLALQREDLEGKLAWPNEFNRCAVTTVLILDDDVGVVLWLGEALSAAE